MRNVRELANQSLITNPDVTAYRNNLVGVRLPSGEMSRAIARFGGVNKIAPDLVASKEATKLVEEAIALGVERTDKHIKRAAEVATQEGKHKIGLFGHVGQSLRELKVKVSVERTKNQHKGGVK